MFTFLNDEIEKLTLLGAAKNLIKFIRLRSSERSPGTDRSPTHKTLHVEIGFSAVDSEKNNNKLIRLIKRHIFKVKYINIFSSIFS